MPAQKSLSKVLGVVSYEVERSTFVHFKDGMKLCSLSFRKQIGVNMVLGRFKIFLRCLQIGFQSSNITQYEQ